MSTKPYDPFERGNIHSLAEVREIFGTGADGRKAARLHRENKPKYDQLRKDAEIFNILGPSRMPSPAPYVKNYESPSAKRFSSEELTLRGKYSEERLPSPVDKMIPNNPMAKP